MELLRAFWIRVDEIDMRKNTIYYKKIIFTYIYITCIALFGCVLCMDGFTPFEKTGDNYFHVFINGEAVGNVGSRERADELFLRARKAIALEQEDLTFCDAQMTLEGEEVLFGVVDSDEAILENMDRIMRGSMIETTQAYTIKVNEYMVNLANVEEVRELLQAAIDRYDSEGKFQVELVQDSEREFNVLTTQVVDMQSEESHASSAKAVMTAGIEDFFAEMGQAEISNEEKSFSDFELGLLEMDFAEEVKIVECYLPQTLLTSLDVAIEEVTKEQETPSEYEVVAGDTLSEISIKVNIPVDKIVEMNEILEDENSTIRIGDKLIITVPEPELSVERVEENYYEEIYDADIIYIDNDEWYTTQTKVLQQPSAGFRKVVAQVNFLNDKEVSREILKEEVVMEAVPKIVERGTKIPPTYIKPISGGRLSSSFGYRSAPTKGASTYHKGVDWAVPTGTAVFASSGGTVSRAGWGSGYGYVVYIDHADGRQTRYGHLSKVLVKTGQTVKQGERIALSGNTGVSTGPHLHFEILINGTQVNPLKYLN